MKDSVWTNQLVGEFTPPSTFAISSSDLSEGATRFEVEFYGASGFRAKKQLEASDFQLKELGTLANVNWPGIFRRCNVEEWENGIPFLTTSEMMTWELSSRNFISRKLTKNLNDLIVEPGTILVSRSGTIGNVVYAGEDFSEKCVSDDALRVVANDEVDVGLIFAFLQCDAGQFMLTRAKSGGVVEHVYEDDLNSLLVPSLPIGLKKRLTALISDSSSCRVQSNDKIQHSLKDVERQCYLEPITDRDSSNVGFVCSSKRLSSNSNYFGSIRLDATAYAPEVLRATNVIRRRKHDELKNLVSEILYIGKVFRTYIDDKALGVPLFGGKDLVLRRFKKDKLLSNIDDSHIDKCRVESGWLLLSRSGNIGRVSMCHKNFESFVASEDILRIKCNDGDIDPYFLFAFLSTAYAKAQLDALIYGSVITHVRKEQIGSILVPIPSDRGFLIGSQIRDAFDLRAKSLELENEALHLISAALRRGRELTEAEWGSEY